MMTLLMIVGPALLGALSLWAAGKCRSKNAKNFFTYGGWGWLLLYLVNIPLFIWPLNTILMLTPSAICFLLAANSIIKEMRSQQRGEYTDAA